MRLSWLAWAVLWVAATSATTHNDAGLAAQADDYRSLQRRSTPERDPSSEEPASNSKPDEEPSQEEDGQKENKKKKKKKKNDKIPKAFARLRLEEARDDLCLRCIYLCMHEQRCNGYLPDVTSKDIEFDCVGALARDVERTQVRREILEKAQWNMQLHDLPHRLVNTFKVAERRLVRPALLRAGSGPSRIGRTVKESAPRNMPEWVWEMPKG
ncbi:MAG: hypothetical protein M1826_005528 [Phylliscum demangeonii]|nr:MAG: hypothetical protein M1826_005528 [Phylliscum demangeonii]